MLQLTPAVGPGSFGLGPVVLHLTRGLRALGLPARIWSTDAGAEREWAAASAGLPLDAIDTFPIVGPRRLAWSPAMARAAGEVPRGTVSVVHQHGLWAATGRATRLLRTGAGAVTVIAAHGSLQPWTLQRSRGKKWLAGVLYEQANLRQAHCLHAVAEAEVADYRDFGLPGPVAVIPNGIDSAWLSSRGDGPGFRARHGVEADRPVLLFLSRITPKKGLDMALAALATVPALRSWWLVVAGAEEQGHQARMAALADRLGVADRVQFVGRLDGQEKRDAFAAADLFVLPSHSEGAPLVVLEALGSGTPVVTTTATPWAELPRAGAGWWVPPSVEAVGAALGEAASLSQDDRRRMGARGRALVEGSYTWDQAAQRLGDLYRWLLDGGRRPDFVVSD